MKPEEVDKAFSPGGRLKVASGCKSDGARVWFGVHKQLSCQVCWLMRPATHSAGRYVPEFSVVVMG